jgi:hypothetical protein
MEFLGPSTDYLTKGKHYEITQKRHLIDDEGDEWFPIDSDFRIVSRASDGPKLLRDMTDAEIGALLRANMRGKIIQGRYSSDRVWRDFTSAPKWLPYAYYRIKPEPTRETVTIAIDGNGDVMGAEHPSDEYRIQFDRVDGVIDRSSLRWEESQ